MDVKLVVVSGKQAGMVIPIRGPIFLIGRGEECQLRPQSTMVSRKHCGIFVEKESVTVEDFGSTNGTYVNGAKTQGRCPLNNGDRLKVGMLEFEVQLSVGVTVPKKSKVQTIGEVATRTVTTTVPVKEDDIDISSWIESDEEVISPSTKKPLPHDTITSKTLVDTTTIPPGSHVLKKEEQKHPKTGKLELKKKPIAENSQTAATDILRKLFNRQKP